MTGTWCSSHPGYARIFAPGRLTVGLFLPLWRYDGDFDRMGGQGEVIVAADRSGFGALWLRDVPLQVEPTADVGQVYDPWSLIRNSGHRVRDLQ